MSDEKDLKATEETPEVVAEETQTETKVEEAVKEEAKEVVEEKKPAYVPVPETPHDEFDWTIGNKHTLTYTEEETLKYLKDYEKSLSSIAESEIVKGKVTAIHAGDVVLDVNYKSDGLVSLSEFRDTPDLKVGDFVDVYVEDKEDLRGQLVLSR